MTRYACPNPECPKRSAVTAAAAPTCYTCARPMREVAPRPELVMEPYIYETDFFTTNQPVSFRNENRNEPAPRPHRADDAQISFNGIPIKGVLVGPFVEVPEPTYEMLLRRDRDGYAMILRFSAPQFVRSGSCAELRLEETVGAQQWAFLVDAHRHNRDLAIECAGLFTSSKARIDGMSASDAPGGGYRVGLLIKAIIDPEAP